MHIRTAAEIFDIEPEKVSKEQRNVAKTINFGLLYGMGAHRLAQSLKIPRAQAKIIWKNILPNTRASCAGKMKF